MTDKQYPQDRIAHRSATLLVGGGIAGALLASSCCILPVVLFALGVSGAWIGNFTRLAPYQPYFVAGAIICIATGYWLIRRAEQAACTADAICARPLPNRVVQLVLLAALILVIAAIGFDFAAPYILS